MILGKLAVSRTNLKDVSDFRCLQPINVVEYHHNRFVESQKERSLSLSRWPTINTFFPTLKELAYDFSLQH